MVCRLLSRMQYFTSVRWGVAYVYPVVSMLVDELVEGQLQADDEIEEPSVFVGRVAHRAYVGCLSFGVLAVDGTSHGPVELWASVSAGDDDGGAPRLSERVEYIIYQSVEVGPHGFVGRVVNVPPCSGGTFG